ncbi:Saccharopine dehydrogenase [Polychytrium aggregatum]|uniref:Saccharopine dehydrogenase n=1 Tax=Polychytrium aggregatum TaxID=110093 RepID=UPI0022FDFE61|nr:Saccharopine dehydrogenase [Polychytrium aggregatum]KAI9193279.1 Saccharopine dehydrogenase [Polychytrium aggregatum]
MAPQQKKILLLGSGFVAPPCLEYLLRRPENVVTIASRTIANSTALAAGRPNAVPITLDVNNDEALSNEIAKHDLVISLIPYTHHARVIKAAVQHKKHVVTTSYISPAMMEYDQAAKDAGITVFNEIGVDPGIDHLYAIKTIDEVHAAGGKIVSFLSYCGGLPAPECSNNPLGYKFSWSSRGVLLALRNNAKYIDGGKVVEIPGPELMDSAKPIYIYPAFAFEGYPNRDSTPYDVRYCIPEAQTVLRGTLRYQGFPKFIKALVALGFLDDTEKAYLHSSAAPLPWKTVFARAISSDSEVETDLIQAIRAKARLQGEEAERIIHGIKWLGLLSSTPVTPRGNLLDTLCATLEQKMQYEEGERDMVMLQHKFGVELADGTKQTRTSTGLWFGVPGGATAMATTVGVPCAITTQLILDGKITRKGVVAPLDGEVVYPLIEALEAEGIRMVEEIL